MAKIKLRSPRVIYATQSGASYAILQIQVEGVTRYNLRKDVDFFNGVRFEYSSLTRDYLDIGFGESTVTNGDFSNGTTDWTFEGDVSLVGKDAFFNSTNELSRIIQNAAFVANQTYEITYEITSYTEGGLRIPFFGVNNSDGIEIPSSVGVHTVTGIAYVAYLQIKRSTDPTTLKITNISTNSGYLKGSNSQYVNVNATLTFYDSSDAQVGTSTSYDDEGYDSWSEFSEGLNVEMEEGSAAQSNTTIYIPEGEYGFFPSFNIFGNEGIIYNSFDPTDTTVSYGQGATANIVRICEPKYNPIKVTFVNKYGALQDLWFDKKSSESLKTEGTQYKRVITTVSGTYSNTQHQIGTINKMGNESIVMNTGYLPESMNEVFKELLLSEQCWARIDNHIYPINVKTSSLDYKTSLNDKLVNFTIQFDYAFNLINNIR